ALVLVSFAIALSAQAANPEQTEPARVGQATLLGNGVKTRKVFLTDIEEMPEGVVEIPAPTVLKGKLPRFRAKGSGREIPWRQDLSGVFYLEGEKNQDRHAQAMAGNDEVGYWEMHAVLDGHGESAKVA